MKESIVELIQKKLREEEKENLDGVDEGFLQSNILTKKIKRYSIFSRQTLEEEKSIHHTRNYRKRGCTYTEEIEEVEFDRHGQVMQNQKYCNSCEDFISELSFAGRCEKCLCFLCYKHIWDKKYCRKHFLLNLIFRVLGAIFGRTKSPWDYL